MQSVEKLVFYQGLYKTQYLYSPDFQIDTFLMALSTNRIAPTYEEMDMQNQFESETI